MVLAANNVNNFSLEDIEWIIKNLFWKYTKNFSRVQSSKRPQDRAEIEFQQRMNLLNTTTELISIWDNTTSYSIIEMACHLDTIEDVLRQDIFTRETAQELSNARKDIAESLWFETNLAWDKITRALYIEDDFWAENIVLKQVDDIITANDNCSPIESLRNKSFSYTLGILWLIDRFTETNTEIWEDFFQKLSELDAQWKLEPEVYAQKFKLILILEIPELSTWEMIYSALERKYPHHLWRQKAA